MSDVDYLCVLLVENRNEDAKLIEETLDDCRDIKFIVERVGAFDEARQALADDTFDITLLNDELNGISGIDFVKSLDQDDPFLPPIVGFSCQRGWRGPCSAWLVTGPMVCCKLLLGTTLGRPLRATLSIYRAHCLEHRLDSHSYP